MDHEIQMHIDDKNFSVIKRDSTDSSKTVFPVVWTLRRKKD